MLVVSFMNLSEEFCQLDISCIVVVTEHSCVSRWKTRFACLELVLPVDTLCDLQHLVQCSSLRCDPILDAAMKIPLCLLLLHGFRLILFYRLFYQGSLFDLLVLAWARGQFCHWAWKKNQVAAMSFGLSFESGFAIKETFVEICECRAKCGLCKSSFQRWLPSFFGFSNGFNLQTLWDVPWKELQIFCLRRENDRFSHFLASSLVAGTSTIEKTQRFGQLAAGNCWRPLAPLPGSTSKWEEWLLWTPTTKSFRTWLPWCFLIFVWCTCSEK